MKKNILFIAWVALFSLFASNSQAQSLKDLLNKDNISKVVNAITGTPETIDMTGTWTYSGSAVEFESDNESRRSRSRHDGRKQIERAIE